MRRRGNEKQFGHAHLNLAVHSVLVAREGWPPSALNLEINRRWMGASAMTISPRAIDAAVKAMKALEDEATADPENIFGADLTSLAEAAITAYLDALAVDGLCLVEANEVEKLRSALKGLSDMYGSTWDRVDGGLMMMDSGVERFEKAHQVAYDVLNPDHPLISVDEDDDVAAASTGDSPRKTEG